MLGKEFSMSLVILFPLLDIGFLDLFIFRFLPKCSLLLHDLLLDLVILLLLFRVKIAPGFNVLFKDIVNVSLGLHGEDTEVVFEPI